VAVPLRFLPHFHNRTALVLRHHIYYIHP
jgi:hypothetical protein